MSVCRTTGSGNMGLRLRIEAGGEQRSAESRVAVTSTHSCLFSDEFPCVLDSFHQIVALNAEFAQAYMLVGEALDEMKDREGACPVWCRRESDPEGAECSVRTCCGRRVRTPRRPCSFRRRSIMIPALAGDALSGRLIDAADPARDARPLLEKEVFQSPATQLRIAIWASSTPIRTASRMRWPSSRPRSGLRPRT